MCLSGGDGSTLPDLRDDDFVCLVCPGRTWNARARANPAGSLLAPTCLALVPWLLLPLRSGGVLRPFRTWDVPLIGLAVAVVALTVRFLDRSDDSWMEGVRDDSSAARKDASRRSGDLDVRRRELAQPARVRPAHHVVLHAAVRPDDRRPRPLRSRGKKVVVLTQLKAGAGDTYSTTCPAT